MILRHRASVRRREGCFVHVQRSKRGHTHRLHRHGRCRLCTVPMKAVKQIGWALQYVPEDLQTPELCLAAVKNDGFSLMLVPHEKRSLELCKAGVERQPCMRGYFARRNRICRPGQPGKGEGAGRYKKIPSIHGILLSSLMS